MSEPVGFNRLYSSRQLTQRNDLSLVAVVPGGQDYTLRMAGDAPFLKNGTAYFPLTDNDISGLMTDTAEVRGNLDFTKHDGRNIHIFRRDVKEGGPMAYLEDGTYLYLMVETGETIGGNSEQETIADPNGPDLELKLVGTQRYDRILQ